MTYKTILVHLHDERRAQRLLDAVVPLARGTRAHLIGLTVMPPFVVIPAMDGTGVTVSVDQHREAYGIEIATLKQKFEQATRGETFTAEWREADASFGTVAGTILDHARTADLVVASQADPDWRFSSMLEEPERIAIESGRPLLLIPNKGTMHLPPRNITVAWNGGREAVRAVFDAMPMLATAQNVDVVWINPEKEPQAGDVPTAEVCAMLSRQGIKCSASHVSAASGDVGQELLRQAGAQGSDLLVMGCYGHSRLREFVLGGASRQVMQHATIPVLLSH